MIVGKYTIVVEGKDDERFLTAVIEARLGLKLKQESLEFFHLENNAKEFSKRKSSLVPRKEAGNEILIVLDADCGSFEQTMDIVQKSSQQLDPKVFLFPNGRDTGRLETLLKRIIPVQNQPYLDCIENYKKCISDLPNSAAKEFDHHKEIFVYVDSLASAGSSKGHERNYSLEHVWNLKSEALNPLVRFLGTYIR